MPWLELCSYRIKNAKDDWKPPEARNKQGRTPAYRLQTFSLQNCETINFCCFNHPVWGALLPQPLGATTWGNGLQAQRCGQRPEEAMDLQVRTSHLVSACVLLSGLGILDYQGGIDLMTAWPSSSLKSSYQLLPPVDF